MKALTKAAIGIIASLVAVLPVYADIAPMPDSQPAPMPDVQPMYNDYRPVVPYLIVGIAAVLVIVAVILVVRMIIKRKK